MADKTEVKAVSNFQSWLHQGEQLYQTALNEFRALETQLDELEAKLAAKQQEVNQIAQVIGKPPVESNRRANNNSHVVHAEIIEEPVRPATSSSNASIARALTGKFGR